MRNNGQSLFEVILATAITAIVLIVIVSVSTSSVKISSSSRDNAQANRYAQEATEWLRSQRDASWSDFTTAAGASATYCINSLNFSTSGSCSAGGVISGTIFSREVTFSFVTTNVANDTVEVNVVVSWTDSSGTHSVSSSTLFTDWKTQVN